MIGKKLIAFLESALENHTDTFKKFSQTNFLKFCYVVLLAQPRLFSSCKAFAQLYSFTSCKEQQRNRGRKSEKERERESELKIEERQKRADSLLQKLFILIYAATNKCLIYKLYLPIPLLLLSSN